jgi:RNA-directed DNA polymerase
MRTPDIEGVATRDGPESCAGTCEGAGEALTGVRAGRAIEPRNHHFGVPTLSHEAEGNIVSSVSASCWRTPRGLRTCACSESSCARTGRSHARPSTVIAGRAAQGTPRR